MLDKRDVRNKALTDRQTDRQTGYPSIDKPWLKYYGDEAINGKLPECTIYEYLIDNNINYPSDIAINYLGRKISYGQLFVNIDRTAAAFLKLGVKAEDIVTIALPNIPEVIFCVYALNKIGAVANMIHPLPGKDEILNYINEVKSKVVVVFDGAYDLICEDISKTSAESIIVVSPSCSLPLALKIAYGLKVKKRKLNKEYFIYWKDFIEAGKGTHVKKAIRDCHSVSIISHTGGTTGEPKGVMCSDYSIIAEVWQVGSTMEHSRQERMMPIIPPFHNYSLVNSFFEPLSLGFVVILLPKYEPEKFAIYVKKYKPNHFNGIPSYWEALLKIEEIKKTDLSCLKHIYYGGEMMAAETEQAVNDLLLSCGSQSILHKGIGSTEMTSASTATYDDCNPKGSVGIPFVRVTAKIVEPGTTTEMKYGQEGEICFSGPTIMIGYFNNQKATDNVVKIHSDGERWLHTGDLGYINEDGVIFVTGRIKRIHITRDKNGQGTKMFPYRIEKTIYKHPAVELCCVIGVPDEERVNYPKAFVVSKVSKDIKEEILDLCRENLPEYMVPVEVEFVDDMPRTPAGKIDYRALEKT